MKLSKIIIVSILLVMCISCTHQNQEVEILPNIIIDKIIEHGSYPRFFVITSNNKNVKLIESRNLYYNYKIGDTITTK